MLLHETKHSATRYALVSFVYVVLVALTHVLSLLSFDVLCALSVYEDMPLIIACVLLLLSLCFIHPVLVVAALAVLGLAPSPWATVLVATLLGCLIIALGLAPPLLPRRFLPPFMMTITWLWALSRVGEGLTLFYVAVGVVVVAFLRRRLFFVAAGT